MPHLHDLYKDVAPFDAREASTILTTTAVLLAIITVGLFVAPTLILGWLPVVLLIATCVFTAAAVVLRFQRPSELTPDKGPADSHNPRLSVVTGRSAQVRGMTGGHELRVEPDSYVIQQIVVTTGPWLGSCPVIEGQQGGGLGIRRSDRLTAAL